MVRPVRRTQMGGGVEIDLRPVGTDPGDHIDREAVQKAADLLIPGIAGEQGVDEVQGHHAGGDFPGVDVAVQIPAGFGERIAGVFVGEGHHELLPALFGDAVGLQAAEPGVLPGKALQGLLQLGIVIIMIVGK